MGAIYLSELTQLSFYQVVQWFVLFLTNTTMDIEIEMV